MMRRGRCAERGYVLVMVLVALAVITLVAQRFAQRNDDLRRNALDFDRYAQGQAAAQGALAATLYWNATRPLMPAGRGTLDLQLRHDGQMYLTVDEARVTIQDFRGLLSINGASRPLLRNFLVQDSVKLERAQAMTDVLDDYIDSDSLKHINGAERPEYQALGLPGPANDWIVSLRELEGMPLWRDDPMRLEKWSRHFSVDYGHVMNPATASRPVLKALFPLADASQLQLLESLRRSDQLRDTRSAQRLTGLPFNDDDHLLAPGPESRVTVWAPGLPRAHEYNVRLTSAGELGPWVITEQHSITRRPFIDEAPPTLPFPLALRPRTAAADRPAP